MKYGIEIFVAYMTGKKNNYLKDKEPLCVCACVHACVHGKGESGKREKERGAK